MELGIQGGGVYGLLEWSLQWGNTYKCRIHSGVYRAGVRVEWRVYIGTV